MLEKNNFINSLDHHQKVDKKCQTIIINDKTIYNVPVVRETGDEEWVISFNVFEKLTEIVMQYSNKNEFDFNELIKKKQLVEE